MTDFGLGVIFTITEATTPPATQEDENVIIRKENADSGTIYEGQVVAVKSTGTGVVQANASDNTKHAFGIAKTQAAVGVALDIVTDGVLEIEDWTNTIGTANLTPNASYWLSTTAGRLTTTPPSTAGQIVQYVGRALSTTQLIIEIDPAVLL